MTKETSNHGSYLSNSNDYSETLTYKGIATKAKHGMNGFIYVHAWRTGFQELIFSTKKEAESYKAKLPK